MNNVKWHLAPLVALGLGLVSADVSAAPGVSGTRTSGAVGRTTTTSAIANKTPTAGPRSTTKGNGITSGTVGGAAKASANTAAVTTLHQAHTLLAQANHDYDGYRAKAAENIAHAIRELGGHHGKTAAGGANKAPAAKGNGMREAQAQSDAQLQQALKLLTGMQGQLPNGHKAAAHVQAAIKDLNTALKIK